MTSYIKTGIIMCFGGVGWVCLGCFLGFFCGFLVCFFWWGGGWEGGYFLLFFYSKIGCLNFFLSQKFSWRLCQSKENNFLYLYLHQEKRKGLLVSGTAEHHSCICSVYTPLGMSLGM